MYWWSRRSQDKIWTSVELEISRYEFALKIAESFNLKKDLIEPIKTAELKQTAMRPLKGGLSTIYAEKILNLEPPSIEHCLHQLKK